MNDGTIKIGTELIQDGLKSGLSGIGSVVKSAGMMTVSAVAAVGAAVGAGVKAGIDYNAEIENYVTNFGVMLGSQEAAADKVLELKEMAAKTPFAMSDLASGTQTLLAFGVASDDTTSYLKMLGDVSLGDAEKFSSLTLAFGQVQSAGKLTGQDLLQMINAGFNPLQVMSEKTGLSMADLKTQMESGAISADMVAEAFASATSEGGQFYNGMEAASQTFDGQVSTLKDNAMSLVGEVVSPISDSLTNELLPQAIGAIDGLTEAFRTGGMDGLVAEAGNVLGEVVTLIAEKAPEFMELVGSLVTSLISTLREQSPLLTSSITSVITQLLQLILESVPELIALGVEMFTGLLTGLASQSGQLSETIKNALVTIITAITDNLPTILDAGIKILLAVVQGISAALPEIIPAMSRMLDQIVLVILENLPLILTAGIGILTAIIEGINAAWPEHMDAIYGIIDSMIGILIENLPLLIDAGLKLLFAVLDGIIVALPELVMYVPEIITAIVDAFAEADMASVGTELMAGIASGITSGVAGLVDDAIKACEKLAQGVKDFFGIKSPSRMFRGFGRTLPSGLAVGVEDEAPVAVDAISDVGIDMRDATAGFIEDAQQEALDFSSASVPIYVKKDLSINGGAKEETIVKHTFDPLEVKATNETGEEVVDKVIEAAQIERWFSGH